MEQLIAQFVSLMGVAALIAAIVNVGKTVGFVQDEQAHKFSAVLSLIAFVSFVYFRVFVPEVDVFALDTQAAEIAKFMLYVLGFLVQMGLPAKFHEFFKGLPLVGKSYSAANG